MRRGEIAAASERDRETGSPKERPHGREVAIKAFPPVAAPVNAIRPEAATMRDAFGSPHVRQVDTVCSVRTCLTIGKSA
jgi:hypothetical protein